MVSREALRGLVLEELLARLLQDNGYRLLVSEKQDPEALVQANHGLLVRGRGGNHQADVIGEFDLPVPFSLPLRVFVEAKFNKHRVRLPIVRNAYGTIHDVNEQYSPFSFGAHPVSIRRYHYRYTLFSASGFTTDAQRYALAHQISLVDLSNPGFASFLDLVEQVADAMYELAEQFDVSPFPIGQARATLRRALGTWTGGFETPFEEPESMDSEERARDNGEEWALMVPDRNVHQRDSRLLPKHRLARIVAGLGDELLSELIVGFPSAPLILILKIDDRADFGTYLARHSSSNIRVHIEFASRGQYDGDWVIVPAEGTPQFRLAFALPDLLADWLLNGEGPAAPRVRDIKHGMLSSIVVFRGNRLVRLLYEPHPDRRRYAGADRSPT